MVLIISFVSFLLKIQVMTDPSQLPTDTCTGGELLDGNAAVLLCSNRPIQQTCILACT